jgi:hypothetical protein
MLGVVSKNAWEMDCERAVNMNYDRKGEQRAANG